MLLFLPLLAAAAAMPIAKGFSDRAAAIFCCVCVSLSALFATFVFAFTVFFQHEPDITLFTWISVGNFSVSWGIEADILSSIMFFTVSSISALIHIYSLGYMHDDPSRPRFFAYLSLFTFMMLMLVSAPNFLQLFFGWEGVGLASYLLIGFWHDRSSANDAAVKAFVVNRIGDAAFILAIAAIFYVFGSLDFSAVFPAIQEKSKVEILLPLIGSVNALNLIGILLLIGAMGKSAQFFLHTWLPDAMEGPTPVSALIHAATMVTAGVFVIARAAPLYEHAHMASLIVALVGGVTAFFAASVALVQNDIKRVVAYSTCSQLGYMFAALGMGFYQAAIFHLFTHAFFKALLFLGAGSVIHGLSDEQDMRRMGGIYDIMPFTWGVMLIGILSLTGFPLTSGYFSKDAILEAAAVSSLPIAPLLFWLLISAAFMTAFYSWRLLFMTFHGEYRGPKETFSKIHESPLVMLVPLGLLAFGALLCGALFAPSFIGDAAGDFWKNTFMLNPHNSILLKIHDLDLFTKLAPPLGAALLGFAAAWYLYIYNPSTASAIAQTHAILYHFLINKWYFDEIYQRLLVNPAYRIGEFFWKKGDGTLIDGLGPDGMARRVYDMTRAAIRLQSGYLYHYAFLMVVALVLLMSWVLVPEGVR